MVRSVNVATPATAFTVVVPPRAASPGLLPMLMVTGPTNEGTTSPCPSRASTLTGESGPPAAPESGLPVNVNASGAWARAVAVSATGAASPANVAVTLCWPSRLPSVHATETSPLASDVPLSTSSDPPPAATVNVTGIPLTGTASLASTRSASGSPRGLPTSAD